MPFFHRLLLLFFLIEFMDGKKLTPMKYFLYTHAIIDARTHHKLIWKHYESLSATHFRQNSSKKRFLYKKSSHEKLQFFFHFPLGIIKNTKYISLQTPSSGSIIFLLVLHFYSDYQEFVYDDLSRPILNFIINIYFHGRYTCTWIHIFLCHASLSFIFTFYSVRYCSFL